MPELPSVRPCHLSKQLALVGLLTLVAACQSTLATQSEVALGNQYAQDGLLREAIDSYETALRRSPHNLTAHRNLGLVLVKAGNYKSAIHHLEEAMNYYADNFDTNFYIAEAYRAEERYADAIFHYQKALKVGPTNERALRALAWSFFRIRYYSEALATARRLDELLPNDIQTSLIMARTLLKLHRFREALLLLKTARATAPQATRPYLASVEGDVVFELGDIAKASRLYRQAIKDEPLLASALLGLGRCYLSYHKASEAITYMERAVRIRPKLTEGFYLLGQAYEKIDAQKSLRYYLQFRKQASSDPEYLSVLGDVKKKIMSLKKEREDGKRL